MRLILGPYIQRDNKHVTIMLEYVVSIKFRQLIGGLGIVSMCLSYKHHVQWNYHKTWCPYQRYTLISSCNNIQISLCTTSVTQSNGIYGLKTLLGLHRQPIFDSLFLSLVDAKKLILEKFCMDNNLSFNSFKMKTITFKGLK